MKAKVTVKKNKTAPSQEKYPYIGIRTTDDDGETIVVFTSYRSGTVLKDARITEGGKEIHDYPIGFYDDDWNEENFKPFHGTIKNKV